MKFIEKKFGGYRQQINSIDSRLPFRTKKDSPVAIVGGGIAGISAAIILGERGFDVDLFEANNYLGGKLGAWPVKFLVRL